MGGTKLSVRQQDIIYDPLDSQKLFHNSESRYKGYSGPIGSGKSQALCQEALRLTYLNPGRTGLLGAPTYPMLRDATQATLFEILGANRIPYEYNKGENILVMKHTGSKILFRPVDDYERLRGTNLAWFGLDELTYTLEEAWLRLEGRLRDPKAGRQCGFAAWTPKGYDWVYRRFIAQPSEMYQIIFAQPAENRHLLKRDPDYYDRLKSSYDDKFYAQEVLGSYLSMDGGRVYGSFDAKTHVQETVVNPNEPIYWALDFNVDPMSSVIAQIYPNQSWPNQSQSKQYQAIQTSDRIVVLDEIVLRHSTTWQACKAFLSKYGQHRPGIVICGDASGFANQTTGASDYDMVKDYFSAHSTLPVEVKVPKSNPSVRERINLTNATLRSAAGEICLVVDPKCTGLVQDFEQVAFKGDSGQIDKDRDRMRTHLSDALGYLLWEQCRRKPTAGERQERIFL